jgi:Zn-dependent protease/predicted transcriptional regulator
MKWSFRVARVFGIDILIHFSFFLIIVIGAGQWAKFGARGMAFGAGLWLLVFLCVTLHELGHSVVAKRFGIPVKRIILLPIGGVAMLGKNPDRPLHELLIAIAGPAVNVVIAAILAIPLHQPIIARQLDPQILVEAGPTPSLALMLGSLYTANVLLVLFNLIPAFPMDGGRMFRAILAMFIGQLRATRIAATIGQIIAVILGVYALMHGEVMLALVAIFVFMGAGAEMVERSAHSVLATKRVGDAYNKTAITLSLDDRVSRVVDHLLTSYQPDFAVVQRGNFQGAVTREDVLQYLSANRYDVFVTEIMHQDTAHVDASLSLDDVRQKMAEASARLVAVYDGQHFLGLVSAEDIAEAHMILSFVQRQMSPGNGKAVVGA